MTRESTPFVYGRCETAAPERNGRPRFYSTFLQDKIKKGLERLGVPLPEESQFFGGTDRDILFLSSHGVVIKIGRIDPVDLLHPAIVQPLGWLQLERKSEAKPDRPLTMVIYPGIEVLGKSEAEDGYWSDDFESMLKNSGQDYGDLHGYNRGYIRILSAAPRGQTHVEVLLDADNFRNGSLDGWGRRKKESFSSLLEQDPQANIADVMWGTIANVFNAVAGMEPYMTSYLVHQPLRRLFWGAFGRPDDLTSPVSPENRAAFWQACTDAVNRPTVKTVPVWRPNPETQQPERVEIPVPLVLCRPWTDRGEDRAPQLLPTAAALEGDIAAAHRALFPRTAATAAPRAP